MTSLNGGSSTAAQPPVFLHLNYLKLNKIKNSVPVTWPHFKQPIAMCSQWYIRQMVHFWKVLPYGTAPHQQIGGNERLVVL